MPALTNPADDPIEQPSGEGVGGTGDPAPDRPAKSRRLVARLAVELAIGLGVAALLVIVAWASSNAISFVYGGY